MTKKQKIYSAIGAVILAFILWIFYQHKQEVKRQEALQAQVLEMIQKKQEAMDMRRAEMQERMQKAFARFD